MVPVRWRGAQCRATEGACHPPWFSGLLGRYLTTQLPQAASVATVETLEVDRQLGKLRIEHPGVRVADGWFEDYRRKLAAFELRMDGPKARGFSLPCQNPIGPLQKIRTCSPCTSKPANQQPK